MDWFTSIIKMAGASFPGTASFVQLLSEFESQEIWERLVKLEDPISSLHSDIPELSKLLYKKIIDTDESHIDLTDELYARYSRAFASLESEGIIKGSHSLQKQYAAGIWITDPSYIIYMCVQFEDNGKMEKLYQQVDRCSIGHNLNGKEIQKELGLPLPVIQAAFQIFVSKGYGICSREIGSVVYIGNA